MRPSCLLLLPLLVITSFCAQTTPAPTPKKWKLVWADEFDTPGPPDSTRWGYDVGGDGWGNNEKQFYRPQNARVADGRLLIEVRREAYHGSNYTSARLVTKNKADWTYGRFEIRARLPSGRGTWPAIWMLATKQTYGTDYWPSNGEIDIMEHVGFDPDVVHATVHTRAYNHVIGTQKGTQTRVPYARTAMHIYVVEWTADRIDAYVDDKSYFSFANDGKGDYRTWPFNRPFHLLLNVAVGGDWGGAQGIDDSIFPQQMEVDYVRVYQ